MQNNSTVALSESLDRQNLTQDWWPSLSNSEQQSLQRLSQCRFDFAAVKRVDSAGLAWTLNAIRDGRANGIVITLCNMPEKMIKLAKISDLEGLLPSE